MAIDLASLLSYLKLPTKVLAGLAPKSAALLLLPLTWLAAN
jgi:hypothetical protein